MNEIEDAPLELVQQKLFEAIDAKDRAYEERNRVVAALARAAIKLKERMLPVLWIGYDAGLGEHQDKPGEEWDPQWRTVVYVVLGGEQMSWHIHDRDKHLFDFLKTFEGKWDGHDTPTKYERLERWTKR